MAKTLVRIQKIENGVVYYSEINRKNGAVMIEDYMSEDRFIRAINSEFGFDPIQSGWICEEDTAKIEKAAKTKAATIKLIEALTGKKVTEYTYWERLKTVEVEIFDGVVNYESFEANTKKSLLRMVYLSQQK